MDTDQEQYALQLQSKKMTELTNLLQTVHDNIEMLFMINNDLQGPDITEGGGAPADQERYQILIFQQKAITQEINRRHILELIDRT